MSTLNLRGLSKAQALAALYNASRPQGMGFLRYDPEPMTVEEAEQFLTAGGGDDSMFTPRGYFDYLKGRVMKLDFSKDDIDPWGYDRDNGQGAAQRALDAAAEGNEAALKAAHAKGVKDAAELAKESMATPPAFQGGVYTMTLEDVKDVVGPKVDEALKAND